MAKVEVKISADLGVRASLLVLGDFATVVEEGAYYGTTIIRTFDGFICLDKPEYTWGLSCSLQVKKLPKGTEITITV